ncbi:Formyltetrahydrofolate-dependent phosphoribosylglycinamide formyltransferase [Planctomycetales bacterium 10988]|nr:Formyltetrahydrofolate-dependent phosphoribosylglycinamide formyltransferase [Planctomycetales bacterium 10988]
MSDASTEPMRIAVLISGGGTTLRNLIAEKRRGPFPVEIALVVASSSQAGGLHYAREDGVPCEVMQWQAETDREVYSQKLFDLCRKEKIELIVMGGFLKRLRIPADYMDRVINIHPSLIPSFCGKGFYGLKVHRAAIQYGVKVSGCTVHFVDDQYDHGPIIAQRVVPVQPKDTPEKLAARIFQEECKLYPEVIQAFAEKRITLEGRTVHVRPS